MADLNTVRQAARQHEVFTKITTDEPWMRCQHDKPIVIVQAHWSDDAPFTVTTGCRNSTQRYTRMVHADGSPSEDFEFNQVDRCRDCGALNTLSVVQEAYGDRSTCSACGSTHWFDIGD